MSGTRYRDPFLDTMILNNVSKRIVDLNEDFNEESMYKLKYWIEKIVNNDKMLEIPDEEKIITIRMETPGGICYSLMQLLSYIDRLKKDGYKIITVCDGITASCGAILFLQGDERILGKYATWMYHNVSSMSYGKVQELKEDLAETERLNSIFENIVLEKTNIKKEVLDEIRKCKKDWYVDYDTAISLGIATNKQG